MGFSRTVRRNMLDHFFGKASYTPPTLFYVGLSSTQPTSTGSNITVPSGGFIRQATSSADWTVATDADPAVITNVNPIIFPAATADWLSGADIAYAVLYDAPAAANFLGYGAFARGKPVYQDDVLTIAVGKLLVGLV